jgi:hypothetical protein
MESALPHEASMEFQPAELRVDNESLEADRQSIRRAQQAAFNLAESQIIAAV